MKSVQVLLFAVLRDAFLREGLVGTGFHLVHAKKKVEGATAGDEGYAERKKGSEDRLEELFRTGAIRDTGVLEAWRASKKRSDMSDALCMCVDAARTKLK
jgi:hypothetical protein